MVHSVNKISKNDNPCSYYSTITILTITIHCSCSPPFLQNKLDTVIKPEKLQKSLTKAKIDLQFYICINLHT